MPRDEQVVFMPREEGGKPATFESVTAILDEIVAKGGDIVKELLRAAMLNPLMGVFVVLVLTDILEKNKIIFKETGILIKTLIVSSAGVELTGEIINVIRAILPFAPPLNPQPDLFRPSPQVVVFGGDSDSIVKALTAKLGTPR